MVFRVNGRMGKVAEYAEAIVYRHHYGASLFCQKRRVVITARAYHQCAAVNADKYRQFLRVARFFIRHGYIEIQAILRAACRGKNTQIIGLCGFALVLGCVQHTLPVIGLDRRSPTQFSHRRFGIGNAAIVTDAVCHKAANLSVFRIRQYALANRRLSFGGIRHMILFGHHCRGEKPSRRHCDH